MIGEISIGGVYIPSLLFLVLAAAVLAVLLSRLVSALGLYELVVYRPLADIAFFLILLGAIACITGRWGPRT